MRNDVGRMSRDGAAPPPPVRPGRERPRSAGPRDLTRSEDAGTHDRGRCVRQPEASRMLEASTRRHHMDRREGQMANLNDAVKRHAGLAIALLVVMAALGGWAGAAGATTISTPITSPCPFALSVPDDLLSTSTGSIKCDGAGAASGADITITVAGNMVMEAGSEITAENTTGGGNGGNISITVSGD